MNRFLFLFGSLIFFNFLAIAQDTISNEKPYSFNISYVGDNVNNLSGGIKIGSCYLGMANIEIGFDFEKAGWWKGTQFYTKAANTHGATPSADLIGDMQVSSNIDAGNHTYIQEFWVMQKFGKVDLTVGLQDLNAEFSFNEFGNLYLNSSFGIMPAISNNISAPIFPLTTLGLTTKWNISEKFTFLNAIYDGSPSEFDNNPYNIKWNIQSGDGMLAVSEIHFNTTINQLAGTYKLGLYSHSHLVEKTFKQHVPDSINHNIFGIFIHTNQILWKQAERQFGFFTQLGYSPSTISINDLYLGLGVNFTGLFSSKGNDHIGLAIAHERLKMGLKSETAIELTYQYQINDNLFIQPDFQYIINPTGTGITLENCVVASLRIGVSF